MSRNNLLLRQRSRTSRRSGIEKFFGILVWRFGPRVYPVCAAARCEQPPPGPGPPPVEVPARPLSPPGSSFSLDNRAWRTDTPDNLSTLGQTGVIGMLAALARFVIRRRKAVLVAALMAMVVAGAVGGGVAKHLSGGGFDDPGAESSQARRTLEAAFGQRTPNLVLLVTSTDGSVDSPQAAAAGVAL